MNKELLECDVQNQYRGQWYEMSLRFKLTLAVQIRNTDDKTIIDDALTVEMKQVVNFIPDKEILDQYAQVIKEKYLTDSTLTCECCEFDGYNYLRVITPNTDNNQKG